MTETEISLELRRRYDMNRERFMRLEKTMVDIRDLIIRTGISNEDAIRLLHHVEFMFQIKLAFEERAKDTQKEPETPETP